MQKKPNQGSVMLQAWLNRARWTQRKLAYELCITEAHASYLISGHRCPSFRMAVKIEQFTGIPARAWLT